MRRSTVFVLAGLVGLVAASTRSRAAEAASPGNEKREAGRPVPCPACRFPCPARTLNCWACGTGVPGAKPAKDIPAVRPVRMAFVRSGTSSSAADAASTSPVIEFERVKKWIEDNPDDYNTALKRLNDLLVRVRGTGPLEAAVTTRLEEVRKEKTAAENKDPEQRKAEAAAAYFEVMAKVTQGTTSQAEKVRLLKRLLRKARDTPYETHVEQRLKVEEAKLPAGSR